MKTRVRAVQTLIVLIASICIPVVAFAQAIPSSAALDAEVSKIMTKDHAHGMAFAVIDHGKVAQLVCVRQVLSVFFMYGTLTLWRCVSRFTMTVSRKSSQLLMICGYAASATNQLYSSSRWSRW